MRPGLNYTGVVCSKGDLVKNVAPVGREVNWSGHLGVACSKRATKGKAFPKAMYVRRMTRSPHSGPEFGREGRHSEG